MPPKKNPNNSLILRGTTWHLHWNVPKHLRNDPLFRGKAICSMSLQTKDVHDARKMRDKLVGQFREMAEASATQISRRAFMDAYAEAKQAKEEFTQRVLYMNDEDAFNAADDLDSAFNVEAAIEKGDITRADAYLAAIHDKREIAAKYSITLKDAAWEFIKEHEGKIDKSVISRVRLASTSLGQFLGKKDVSLHAITNRQVTRWIEFIASTSSDGTRKGYIAALHKMWYWAWMQEHVEGESPFKGTKIEMKGDSASYEDFTVDEVRTLLSLANHGETELMRYGLITGCRLGEILSLKAGDFHIIEGVHAIEIVEGKTAAAARLIPLPVAYWEGLKSCVTDKAWGNSRMVTWSQRFSTLKTKAIGSGKDTKTFHSFRHMAATSYERAGIEERITSVILGHKNKRGESMSYGLYSAGLSPSQYLDAVTTMVNSQYAQQFLKLFNK